MTQDEYNRLFIRVLDEIADIKYYQSFLKIALEQLDNPTDFTVHRVELLLSTYLEQVEPYFDNLDYFSKQRDESRNNILPESQT